LFLAADYPFLDVLWTMLVFFGWVIWFWLLITVFGDLFSRHDISGWGKAGWIVLVVVLPYLGVFIYLIARGNEMGKHALEAAQAQDTASRQYIQSVTTSSADELAKLAALKADGTLSEDEFIAAKAKLLGP
jgi:hypothetical protein